jgi:hypothetical protein
LRDGVSDYELIETRAELDSLAQDLLGEKTLAVDTEADSFYHYYDKTCLVQIATIFFSTLNRAECPGWWSRQCV